MSYLKDKMTDAATKLSEGTGDAVGNLQSRAKEAWSSVQHDASRAVDKSSAYVRKNAAVTALVAFGIGLLVAAVLSRVFAKLQSID